MIRAARNRFLFGKVYFERGWVRVVLLFLTLVSLYDLFGAQLISKAQAEKMPRLFDLITRTTGWVPWFWWVIIILSVVIVALFEGDFRRWESSADVGSERDAWFQHAIYYVIHHSWPKRQEDVSLLEEHSSRSAISEAVNVLRQLAFNRQLRVWGKPFRQSMTLTGDISPDVLFQPIAPEYWCDHAIAYPGCLSENPARAYTSEDGLVHDQDSMCALKLSRTDVEKFCRNALIQSAPCVKCE